MKKTSKPARPTGEFRGASKFGNILFSRYFHLESRLLVQLSSKHTCILKWCLDLTVCEAEEQCFMKEHLVKSLFLHHTNPLRWISYDLCMMQTGTWSCPQIMILSSFTPICVFYLRVAQIKKQFLLLYLTLVSGMVTLDVRPTSKWRAIMMMLRLWFWYSKWRSGSWDVGWIWISS